MKKPSGEKLVFRIKDYVLYLPSSTGIAMTALGYKYEDGAPGSGKPSFIPIPTTPSVDEAPPEPVAPETEAVDARLAPTRLLRSVIAGEQALRWEAKSLANLLAHVPKNPFCNIRVIELNRQNRRRTRREVRKLLLRTNSVII